MGSQTLEILRQGVWASITGGWFYDPHQNVFCNTAHLYIWLFLLCLPFTFYLYFPPSIVGWCVYCALVSILFGSIKLVNYALHHMYDTSECIIVPPDNTAPPEKRRMQKKNRNDEDFELQVLSGGRMPMSQQSDNESVGSRVFHKPTNSTIDLKVDVHRKNSSESSGEESEGATAQAVVTKVGTVRRAERVTQPSHQQNQETEEASTSQGARRRSRPRTARRWAKHHSGDRQPPGAKTQERRHGSEEALRMELCSKTEDAVAVNIDEYTAEDTQARRGPSTSRGDSNEADFPEAERYLSKFARRLSSDSRDNSEPSVDDFQTSPVERKSSGGPQRQRYFGVYPAESCTKSAVALARPSSAQPQMRRNSNSTMSAIQLPLAGSTARLLAHVRRHSNVTDAGLGFLPTGSVELGAYMLEKADAEAANGKGKADGEARPPGVRRIKSAALEIGCPPPSVSNLSPHPNSAETIGGQVLKNPESAVIPPPSKSLIRNPHLNLWPKGSGEGGDGDSSPYMNYGSEIVYPIAEISDEMQTSQGQESDPESLSSRCDSDYEEDDGDARTLRRQLRGFDSDFDRPLRIDSSDAEYENNGSRSPLLDRGDRLDGVKIVKTKSDKADCDHRRQSEGGARGLSKNGSFSADTKRGDKHKSDRNKRLLKNNSFSATPTVLTEESVISTIVGDADDRRYEGRLTECSESVPIKSKQKNDKTKSCDPVDRFDEASGSSKDFLIEKSSVESDEGLLNFEKNQQKLALVLDKEEVRKPPDPETSNSSISPETRDVRREATTETSEVSEPKTLSDGPSEDLSPAATKEDSERRLQSDENSFYGITWLFDESNHCAEKAQNLDEEAVKVSIPKPSTSAEPPRNLGAIPKQVKNLTRTRASSLKENKKKDKHKDKERDSEGPTQEELDTVEAHSALVQGLECLFAAANANSVVMPPLGREERPRSHRQAEHNRRDGQKPRKRSIEEMAQTTTNTILPTSMPLLAAFLNSRVDYPHVPIYLPGESEPGPSCSEVAEGTHYGLQRTRPLIDRNHRNRMRKIKRSTRSKNTDHSHQTDEHKMKDVGKSDSGNAGDSSGNIHFATSFEDTTDGAIHCFINEYGSWMSYTFDKNSTGHAKEAAKVGRKLSEVTKGGPESPGPDGSCTSIASDATGPIDSAIKAKQGDVPDQGVTNGSIYNSSSNQGSNNPLLSSNNSTTMVPVTQTGINLRTKMIYVMEPTAPAAHRRLLASNLSDSVMERIEMQRMVSPNLQISYLLNSNIPAEPGAPNMLQLSMPPAGSVGDNSLDRENARKRFRLIDSMEYAGENRPTAYYKFKLFKCWQIKVTMDRLKLMALLDRNLTLRETILSILLGISVSIFGATVLNMGFYKDVYAFWFCFVIAGSQYSLLKSVQPDSASPVHGFNRMVAFSRPVYFCICAALLCTVHYNLESFNANDKDRSKRNADDVSEKFTFYGMDVKTKAVLELTENVISKFLLCFPLAFSLGLFPQVNTFTMYLFEQADMHIFGGNATASLTASMYCVFRSLLAVAVLYGFAYGGLTESKGSQHILFSMFCALVVPISYHLSRCASDYAMVWNLIKNHLIPADLYAVHSANSSNLELETNVVKVTSDKTTPKNKHDSESNISKQPSVGSSTSKINFSSETNISKSQKRSQTSVESSVNSLKMDSNRVNLNSSGSIKMEPATDEATDQTKTKTLNEEPSENEMEDPLPRKLQETVNSRFKNDIIVCSFMALFIFGIHCTTVFSTLQPELNPVVWSISGLLGWILHYLMPQLRKQLPWLWLSGPALQAREHTQFEVREPARVMWFEKAYVYLCFIERNLLYPVVFISAVTQDSPGIVVKFGPGIGALIICICALKGVRNAYSDPDNQYLILLFAVLLFRLDYHWASESFLVDYFMMAIIFNKTYEFLLKIQFVVTYIAPWQITWGSAFHAFAQPFSVPHSAMLFLQAAISALLSTPLNPILGSAIFMSSYVRPVKFWERDYNTKRVDQSNTRLSSQLERNLGSDDNNLNSIFYEHLTRSLQHYLCGDLLLGRWGQVQQGDCFVLASDYLNCLVHIVEMGNGLVSFQLRGLEFRGTYCQQREVEAISEGPEDNDGCCCCAVGHLPHMLSVNAMFSLRWLAWQLTTARYVLEGYSISDNSAISMLQVFDFRKVLITYYVKSIIFYTIQSPKLEEWLASASILEALKPTLDRNFIDLDPIFNLNLDEDYDFRASGITRASFCSVYHEWVSHCGMRREDLYKQKGDKLISRESALVSLCFGLSLVGRRSLGAASHNSVSNVEFFLYGLHALFKGDFRITCVRDEWVFSDMSLLHSVLAPAVRMALKLHQDHFMSPEEYCSCPALYSAISCHTACLVICHEASPTWRNNVLRGAPHLLALRHVMDEGNDEYKIIMLNKRYLSFRVIKLNRECVRGLWAGQQQELVYLRNRNPERGSIQNAKQALRNIINSSCDQPIGYPIYVSPLTTSYAETNQQLTSLTGGSLTLSTIKRHALGLWRKMRRRCGEGCSSGSGSGSNAIESGINTNNCHLNQTPHHTLELSRTSLAGTRGSLASVGKPGSSTLVSLAGLLGSREQPLAPAGLQAQVDLPITAAATRLFFERDSETGYATIKEAGESKSNAGSDRDRDSSQRDRERDSETVRSSSSGRSSSWRNNTPANQYTRDTRLCLSIRDRARDGARRSKRDRERDRIRPSSFRLLSALERDNVKPPRPVIQTFEENPNPDWVRPGYSKDREGKAPSVPKEVRRGDSRGSGAKMSTAASFPTPESSAEDLSYNPGGDSCQIIANRNANMKHSESHKRRSSDFAGASGRDFVCKHHNSEKNIDNIVPKDLTLRNMESSSEHSVFKRSGESPRELTKTSKDLRHDRESYRELTGKYNELSMKETGLRIAADPKDSVRLPIVKRSESLKAELKNHVSVGCKVVIIDPSGVYDCINLGRRIDVTWPSVYQRHRGGRNHWSAWVPQQGMDGQVVHRWTPNHRDPALRSHVDKTILLVQIGDRFVPIAENCVQDLGDEV